MFYVFRAALLVAFILSLSPVAVSAAADGDEDASNTYNAVAGVAEDAEDSDGMDSKDKLLPDEVMKAKDKDKDGFLTLVELHTAEAGEEEYEKEDKKLMEKAFNTADADKDGKLSATELPVALEEYEGFSEAEGEDGENTEDSDSMDGKDAELSADDIMKEMDTDKDGFVSLVELHGAETGEEQYEEEDKKLTEKVFNTADADKDGKLSAAELPMAIKEFESFSEVEDENGENPEDSDSMEGKDAELSPDDTDGVMKEMDTDKDGFLSLLEVHTAEAGKEEYEVEDKKLTEKVFNTADADKDGKLSAAELPVAIKEFERLSEAEGEGGETF